MAQISSRGVNETPTIPHRNSDKSSNMEKQTLTSIHDALKLVSKNVNIVHCKLKQIETTDANVRNMQARFANLETIQSDHTRLLSNIYDLLKQATSPDDEDDTSKKVPDEDEDGEEVVDTSKKAPFVVNVGDEDDDEEDDDEEIEVEDDE
jgi:hypothetical protein